MKTLREYRKENKLSQATLAEILKTNRSQINMAEQGKRSLPEHAKKRFVELVKTSPHDTTILIEKEMAIAEGDVVLNFEAKHTFENLLMENRIKQSSLKRRIIEMQQKFDKKITRSKGFENVLEVLPNIGGAVPEINYFGVLQREAEKKLMKYGKGAQLPLQVALYVARAEEKILQQYLSPATAPAIGHIIADNNVG